MIAALAAAVLIVVDRRRLLHDALVRRGSGCPRRPAASASSAPADLTTAAAQHRREHRLRAGPPRASAARRSAPTASAPDCHRPMPAQPPPAAKPTAPAAAAPRRRRAAAMVAVTMSGAYPFEVCDGSRLISPAASRTSCSRNRRQDACASSRRSVPRSAGAGRRRRRTAVRVLAAGARPPRASRATRRLQGDDRQARSRLRPLAETDPAAAGDYQVTLVCPDGQNPVQADHRHAGPAGERFLYEVATHEDLDPSLAGRRRAASPSVPSLQAQSTRNCRAGSTRAACRSCRTSATPKR